jgi:hypothetical protein
MGKTKQGLWQEVLRMAKTLREAEPHQTEPPEEKMAMDENISA